MITFARTTFKPKPMRKPAKPTHKTTGKDTKEEEKEAMPKDVDFIVTYVDSNDPSWLKEYNKYSNETQANYNKGKMRFRSWDNLQYQIRGVHYFMPFVRNIFLVVASDSQVPSWVNRDEIKVVKHSDFMPKETLPTFNSQTIEAYLWNIPGLGDKFIYANDDMFILKKCEYTDFFEGNKPVFRLTGGRCTPKKGTRCYTYDMARVNALNLAIPSYRKKNANGMLCTQHIMYPYYKPDMIKFYNDHKKEIDESVTKFRHEKNFSPWMYLFNAYHIGHYKNKAISTTYCRLQGSISRAQRIITTKACKLVCLNDDSEDTTKRTKNIINSALHSILPRKTKYELSDEKGFDTEIKVNYKKSAINNFLY